LGEMEISRGRIALEVERLTKRYDEATALKDVSFVVEFGQIVAVLGPSGSGKSTLLNLIAGLEEPDSGSIRWEGQDLAGVPTHARDFGLMFQEYALFPHLDVAGNVGFGLRMHSLPDNEQKRRIERVLDLVDLKGYERRQVDTLSGGERQRVALARSLAPRPRLLMLDEPLGALDRTLRERLLLELPAILKEMGQTALYVTHDQREAFALAQRVVLLNAGQVEQTGTPLEIYHSPRTPFVARFLGLTNLFPARLLQGADQVVVETPLGIFPLQTDARGPVTVLLRPDRLQLVEGADSRLTGTVVSRSFRGDLILVQVRVGEFEIQATLDSDDRVPPVGQEIKFSFEPAEALQVLG
jgi:ABC-type Fe3+/spermidine/putrescine transport system ATPase subunit